MKKQETKNLHKFLLTDRQFIELTHLLSYLAENGNDAFYEKYSFTSNLGYLDILQRVFEHSIPVEDGVQFKLTELYIGRVRACVRNHIEFLDEEYYDDDLLELREIYFNLLTTIDYYFSLSLLDI